VFIGLLFLVIFGPSKLPQMRTAESQKRAGDSSAKRPPRSRGASGSPSNAAEDRIHWTLPLFNFTTNCHLRNRRRIFRRQ
jgi:hypothetical protein